MTPVTFPQVNARFGPPVDMAESQVRTIMAYRGFAKEGSCDGAPLYVTAWLPDQNDIQAILAGKPVFVTIMADGLPPHMLTTHFQAAIHPV